MENIQCGFNVRISMWFQKRFQCTTVPYRYNRKKAKRIMDKGGQFSALLPDLSKAFDWLHHDLLIAKLNAHGFKNGVLYLKVQSCKLCNNKTYGHFNTNNKHSNFRIHNCSSKVLFTNRKGNRNCQKVGYFLRKVQISQGYF